MRKHSVLMVILLFFVLTAGCSNTNSLNTNPNEKVTPYFTIENGKKNYHENYEFAKDIAKFDLTLDGTVKSFNEVKDGKRDLSYIKGIEAEDLKKDKMYKIFSDSVPGNSELKTERAEIKNYFITGMQYDKDQSLIKVYISIETYEKQGDKFITVLNNQTYIYEIENNTVLLAKYDLAQYLK